MHHCRIPLPLSPLPAGSLRIRSIGNTSLARALSCIIKRSDSSSVVSNGFSPVNADHASHLFMPRPYGPTPLRPSTAAYASRGRLPPLHFPLPQCGVSILQIGPPSALTVLPPHPSPPSPLPNVRCPYSPDTSPAGIQLVQCYALSSFFSCDFRPSRFLHLSIDPRPLPLRCILVPSFRL